MKLFLILRYIFIPFYSTYKILTHKEYCQWKDFDKVAWSMIYSFALLLYMIIRLGSGISDANTSGKCVLRSIGDVMISPMYSIGCNLGKDRFEIKVN